MKNKQTHYRNASFLALFFVILGYVVKFYPEQVRGFDQVIQMTVRGSLPPLVTAFWSHITKLGEMVTVILFVGLIALFFYWKRWKAEALLIIGSLVLLGGASTALKLLYQRPRPTIEWLVHTTGFSFPSWHTASTMLLAGVLAIVVYQRIATPTLRYILQGGLILLAVLVAISRIYVGVHYPTDIIGGWLLALFILELCYPLYDRIRFTWRFQNKQK